MSFKVEIEGLIAKARDEGREIAAVTEEFFKHIALKIDELMGIDPAPVAPAAPDPATPEQVASDPPAPAAS